MLVPSVPVASQPCPQVLRTLPHLAALTARAGVTAAVAIGLGRERVRGVQVAPLPLLPQPAADSPECEGRHLGPSQGGSRTNLPGRLLHSRFPPGCPFGWVE